MWSEAGVELILPATRVSLLICIVHGKEGGYCLGLLYFISNTNVNLLLVKERLGHDRILFFCQILLRWEPTSSE